jgi:hypothetical protein
MAEIEEFTSDENPATRETTLVYRNKISALIGIRPFGKTNTFHYKARMAFTAERHENALDWMLRHLM